MVKFRIQIVITLAAVVMLSACLPLSADTWRLEQGRDWKPVQPEGKDKYLLAVAEIKKLVNTGKTEAVTKALNKLKKEFPEIAGPDLDAFMEAEMLFSKGSFVKAVNSYDNFLVEFPESRFFDVVLDRQFAIATAYLAGQKRRVLKVFKLKGYEQGERIMDRITDRAGEAPIGKKAAIAVAKSYEKRGKFDEAYLEWSQISSRWPTGQMAKNALLGMARCKHAAYKGPKYDSSDLISAKSYYENFKLRYPKDAEKFGVDKILRQIDRQLAYKQFSIGRHYQKIGNKQSANFYYQMVIDNWPNSTAAKQARKMMSDMNLRSEKVKK